MKKFYILITLGTLTVLSGCKAKNPVATIVLDDGRQIKIELYEDIAPISVKNFIKLAKEGYYNNVVFHRVIEGFMIQTGGYYLDGQTITPKPNVQSIYGEFSDNGWTNNLTHELGVISMARTNVYDSASSQFFLCVDKAPHLDGQYAAFGKAIDEKSMEIMVEISKQPTTYVSSQFTHFLAEPITIKKVIIK